ncbi:MAG: hypothetical protein J7K88_07840 [Candidatus Fermentibacteraceae bacterium]|nr:hypothetical protein [Candidatus Fermentibacteraceae bacterium]
MTALNGKILDEALGILGERLQFKGADPVRLVVCGGSALIALNLVTRSTNDVDVVAMVSENGELFSPVPFPEILAEAVDEVATLLELQTDWLNYGPSSNSGGLFQTGLPDGLLQRAHQSEYGDYLQVFFIDRRDQVFFKVFAAADRLGVHVDDLVALNPTSEEMEAAALWCITHDPSDGFRGILISMFKELGYEDAAKRL